jgi:hypothetical protein
MNKSLCKLAALALMGASSLASAQGAYYGPNVDTGRFASPEATPEVKSWAPYDTATRPEVDRSSSTYYPPRPGDNYGQGTPQNRINAPIPYMFAPIAPSGPFLLR